MPNMLLLIELHTSDFGDGMGLGPSMILANWSLEDFEKMKAIYEKMKDELEHGKTLED